MSKANSEFYDYLPPTDIKSQIVTYEEFTLLWNQLPAFVKIRIPSLVHTSLDNNLDSLFHRQHSFLSDYKFSILLIQA